MFQTEQVSVLCQIEGGQQFLHRVGQPCLDIKSDIFQLGGRWSKAGILYMDVVLVDDDRLIGHIPAEFQRFQCLLEGGFRLIKIIVMIADAKQDLVA